MGIGLHPNEPSPKHRYPSVRVSRQRWACSWVSSVLPAPCGYGGRGEASAEFLQAPGEGLARTAFKLSWGGSAARVSFTSVCNTFEFITFF